MPTSAIAHPGPRSVDRRRRTHAQLALLTKRQNYRVSRDLNIDFWPRSLRKYTAVNEMFKMTSSQSFLIAALACLAVGVSAQDHLTRVTLNKRPLDLQTLEPQKRAEQLALLSANAGEDIPILNFLDAQVTRHKHTLSPTLGVLAC